ncbi:hypothetical protein BYT27DRAFT_7201244 [Phlegmacium glaucopus]|nr:hypothetical protein BYT27DRAFT_7201244 [Phlegmacium glaucopus]
MAGAELKELKEKTSGKLSWYEKQVNNIANGYSICSNDFATTLIQLANADFEIE